MAALSLAPTLAEPPFLCLLASGGHTLFLDVPARGELVALGGTLDDAAGEAFDKGARLLGRRTPAAPRSSGSRATAIPSREPFPRALAGRPGCDVSFSGLKSALARRVAELGERAAGAACRSRGRLPAGDHRDARRAHRARARRLGAGCARDRAVASRRTAPCDPRSRDLCAARGVELLLAPPALCVDNAAMIASVALDVEPLEPHGYLDLDAYARSPVLRPLHSADESPTCARPDPDLVRRDGRDPFRGRGRCARRRVQ